MVGVGDTSPIPPVPLGGFHPPHPLFHLGSGASPFRRNPSE